MVFFATLTTLKAAPLTLKAPSFFVGLTVTAISQHSTDDWEPWKVALIFALLSGVSLPFGAALGIYMTPLKPEGDQDDEESEEEVEAEERRESIVACCLAFGAGALLFAVTVELYGEAMRELEHDGYKNGALEIAVMCAAAMAGALLYTRLNRWLDAYLTQGELDLDANQDIAPLARQAAGRKRTASSWILVRSTGLPGAGERKRCITFDSPQSRTSRADTESGRFRAASFNPQGRKLATLSAVNALTSGKVEQSRVGAVSFASSETCDKDIEAEVITSTSSRKLEDEGGKKSPLLLGMATWLGVFIDGLPEGVLLGFLAAEGRLSMALVVSLFIANFPEAFSSASLLRQARKPVWAIMGLWTSLFVITAVLAALAAFVFPPGEVPFHWKILISFTEGIAGGAMLACIAAVMLPEAYQMQGDLVGLLTVAGFLVSVLVKVFGGVASEYDDNIDKASHVALLALGRHAHMP